jgi:hypothetical protein
MWKKTFGGLLLVGTMCCGSMFAAPATSSNATNSWNTNSEIADGCGTSCAPKRDCAPCKSSCDSCEDDYFTAHVDWLFWKLHRSGMDYAVDNNGSVATVLDGHCCAVEPDRDHGVRIGMGYKTCDCWDLALDYTHWQAEDSSSCGANDCTFATTRAHPDVCTSAEYGYGAYETSLHKIDLTAGYMVNAGCDVMVRPFAGITLAFVDQSYDTIYWEDYLQGSGSDLYTIAEEVNMDAYGFMAGVDMSYGFWDCFSWFGRAAGTVAYGDFEVTYFSDHYELPSGTVSVDVDYSCDSSRIISMLELSTGFEWKFYDCDWAVFKLAIGWEMQSWHNMADFANFTDNKAEGNSGRQNAAYGLEGLFVRVGGQF